MLDTQTQKTQRKQMKYKTLIYCNINRSCKMPIAFQEGLLSQGSTMDNPHQNDLPPLRSQTPLIHNQVTPC